MNDQIAEVKLKTDIVSIIGERIELKKAGRNYKAPCPFHGEKTPSFMVSPELQIFKCFGCAEAGDVFTFLEKYEGMEFPEALKYLADRAGIKLERGNFNESSEKEKLIELNSQVLKFYNYMLTEHSSGKNAYNYLLHDRGLTKEIIKEFQLGYSPENSFPLSNFLIGKKKYSQKEIETAGIGLPTGLNIYDRFNGRVIFPLFDHRGNPIGFAGRVLPWDKRDTGKYINTPETPLYHKSHVLFGLNLTRGIIKKKKVAIIVEGELDAISSYQAGIKNVVAIKGSALTEDQVRLLSRFAEKFILALDSDMAGDAAARRGLTIAGNLGVEVKVAKITGGKDPDEAARTDLENYKKDLIHAEGVWDYLIDSVFARFDATTGVGKAKISKEISPVLTSIEDKIVQAHYINVVAARLGVPVAAVEGEINKTPQKEVSQVSESISLSIPKEANRQEKLENQMLSILFLISPQDIAKNLDTKLIMNTVNKKIIDSYLEFMKKEKVYETQKFSKFIPPELFESFSGLVFETDSLEERPDELKKELDLIKKELKILMTKEKLKLLTLEMRSLESAGETEKLIKIQNEFNKLAKSLSGYEESEVGGIILTEE